jgi:hypothetical protein
VLFRACRTGLLACDGGSQAGRSRLWTVSRPPNAVEEMADWSPWVPFEDALASAPLLPGVYMARQRVGKPIVYVGMAGERAAGGRPKGLRGRLGAYITGKGLVSGLGEAAMDRALADPDWLRERLVEAERGHPMRATEWGRAALGRAGLEVRWATTATAEAARNLEKRVDGVLDESGLWNRGRAVMVKPGSRRAPSSSRSDPS